MPGQQQGLLEQAPHHPHTPGRVESFQHAEGHQRPHHEGVFRSVALEPDERASGSAQRSTHGTVYGTHGTVRRCRRLTAGQRIHCVAVLTALGMADGERQGGHVARGAACGGRLVEDPFATAGRRSDLALDGASQRQKRKGFNADPCRVG